MRNFPNLRYRKLRVITRSLRVALRDFEPYLIQKEKLYSDTLNHRSLRYRGSKFCLNSLILLEVMQENKKKCFL